MTKIIRNNKVYGGTPNNLGDIQNVDITSPTNNQALVYDSSTNKWKNDNVSAVGSLNDLTDVSISNIANKQELVYDSTDSEFKNKTTRIELTQAEYNALANPLPDVDYYITDAPSMQGSSKDLSYDGTTLSTHDKIEGLNASDLPITSGSATNTKTYIDSGLSGKQDKIAKGYASSIDANNLYGSSMTRTYRNSGASIANCPENDGTLFVFSNGDGNSTVQFFTNTSASKLYMRVNWAAGSVSWSAWKTITLS